MREYSVHDFWNWKDDYDLEAVSELLRVLKACWRPKAFRVGRNHFMSKGNGKTRNGEQITVEAVGDVEKYKELRTLVKNTHKENPKPEHHRGPAVPIQ